jgi:hypothetical protein
MGLNEITSNKAADPDRRNPAAGGSRLPSSRAWVLDFATIALVIATLAPG